MSDRIEPEPLDIESDKYRYEACSITEEECHGINCRTCKTARCELKDVHEEEQKSIYTFKDKTQHGIGGKVNLYNTVLKCGSVDDAFTYMDISDSKKNKYVKVLGLLDQDVIDKEHPHLNTVMEMLDLKPCTESYYFQKCPLVTVHGDVVLATAPRIESDTAD